MTTVGSRPRSADGQQQQQQRPSSAARSLPGEGGGKLSSSKRGDHPASDDGPVLKTYSPLVANGSGAAPGTGNNASAGQKSATLPTKLSASDVRMGEDGRQVQYYKFFTKAEGGSGSGGGSGGTNTSPPGTPVASPSPSTKVKGIKFYRTVSNNSSAADLSDDSSYAKPSEMAVDVGDLTKRSNAVTKPGGSSSSSPRPLSAGDVILLPMNETRGGSARSPRSPKNELKFVVLSTPSPTESYKFFTKPTKPGEKTPEATPSPPPSSATGSQPGKPPLPSPPASVGSRTDGSSPKQQQQLSAVAAAEAAMSKAAVQSQTQSASRVKDGPSSSSSVPTGGTGGAVHRAIQAQGSQPPVSPSHVTAEVVSAISGIPGESKLPAKSNLKKAKRYDGEVKLNAAIGNRQLVFASFSLQ